MRDFLRLFLTVFGVVFFTPNFAFAQEGSGGGLIDPDKTIAQNIESLYNQSLGIILTVAFLVVIFAGYTYLTSFGNQDKINQAKMLLFGAVTGVIFLLIIPLILNLLGANNLSTPALPTPATNTTTGGSGSTGGGSGNVATNGPNDIAVPFQAQDPGSSDCGRASVGMVVNYYRQQQGLSSLPYSSTCPTSNLRGNLNSQLNSVGGPAYIDSGNISLQDPNYISNIVNSIDNDHPVVWMTDLSASGYGHFVVLRGYQTDSSGNITTFIANDPGSSAGNGTTQVQGVTLTPANLRLHGEHQHEGTGYFYVR